jgi:hypothetical protein
MQDNPYRSPAETPETSPLDNLSPTALAEIRQTALLQKGLIVCIALQIVSIIGAAFLPQELKQIVAGIYVVVALAGGICTFLLAMTLYGIGLGILMSAASGIPCVGLFVLLTINGKATAELREYGVEVGLFGVPWSKIPK